MHNNIIEKDLFSTERKGAIIRVVAPVQSGSQEMCEGPKNWGEKKPPCSSVVCPRTVL